MTRSLLSKCQGTLLGALLGDCLGAPFENEAFPPAASVVRNYLVTLLDSESKKSQPYKAYTDDSTMTFGLANSLVEKKTLDPRHLAEQFTNDYIDAPRRGYGPAVCQVFYKLDEQEYRDPFGPASEQFEGSGSYGNGAAMRVSPCAIAGFLDRQKALQFAKTQSLITHAHREGYQGAMLQCLAIWHLLHCDDVASFDWRSFCDRLMTDMREIEAREVTPDSRDRLFSKRLERVLEQLAKNRFNHEVVRENLGTGVSAWEAVPCALYVFLRAQQPLEEYSTDNPFVRTIYIANRLGGDTDTIGSMAAAMTGALHGKEIIPQQLIDHCETPNKALLLAEELYDTFIKKEESPIR